MRVVTTTASLIVVVLAFLLGEAFAADPYQVNVTLPTVSQNFITGEKLPLVYRISADSSANTIQLDITLVNPRNATDNLVLFANADISKGFSQQVRLGDGTLVYEHQENYNIPLTTTSGEYNVVFTNTLNGVNTTIPINIAQASRSSTNKTGTAGVGGHGNKSMWSDSGSTFASPQLILSAVLAVFALFF